METKTLYWKKLKKLPIKHVDITTSENQKKNKI